MHSNIEGLLREKRRILAKRPLLKLKAKTPEIKCLYKTIPMDFGSIAENNAGAARS